MTARYAPTAPRPARPRHLVLVTDEHEHGGPQHAAFEVVVIDDWSSQAAAVAAHRRGAVVVRALPAANSYAL